MTLAGARPAARLAAGIILGLALLPGCNLILLPFRLFFSLLHLLFAYGSLAPALLVAAEDPAALAPPPNPAAEAVLASPAEGRKLDRLADDLLAAGRGLPPLRDTARAYLASPGGACARRLVLAGKADLPDAAAVQALLDRAASGGLRLRCWLVATAGEGGSPAALAELARLAEGRGISLEGAAAPGGDLAFLQQTGMAGDGP